MSGDVQPRKRKDKKKKKDDLGIEEPRGTAAALGEGDIFMHSQSEHGTGGNWCAKVIFFSLLAVLVTLIGLIILENRGLSELEANSVESRYAGVLEGWLEEGHDDDHHDEHTLDLLHHDDEDDDDDHDGDLEHYEEDHDEDDHDDEHEDDDDHSQEDEDDEDENEENNDDNQEANADENDDEDSQEADDDDEDEESEEKNLETAEEEDEDEVEEVNYKRYYRSVQNQANDDDDDDDEDDLRKVDDIDEDDDSAQNDKDDDESQQDETNDDSQENNEDDDNQVDSQENNDDDDVRDQLDENEEDDEDSHEGDEDEAPNDEDEDQPDDHQEEDDVEVEHIEKEVFDEDVSTEAPAEPEDDKSEEESNEVNPLEEVDDDDVEFLEPGDLDELPAVLPIPVPKGKPLPEVDDSPSTQRPQDTLADEEEYEREQEARRKEKEESSQGMWLKLVVGGALLVATQAVLRRATAPREPEEQADSSREETPLSDRRMTLIAEPVAPPPLVIPNPEPVKQIEVVKQEPIVKSAPPPPPEESEEEEVEEEEEEIVVAKDLKPVEASNDVVDKESYSDEDDVEEEEEEEEIVEPPKPTASKLTPPTKEPPKPPVKEIPKLIEKKEPPKPVEKEPTPEEESDEDDVEIIEDEDIGEEIEEEEDDISDVDDAELLNRLEAKYGRLPEPERPGWPARKKDGGNSLEDEWPGEPSDAFWRDELDHAEQDLRRGEYTAASERASAPQLGSSARARYVIARALDSAAEAKRDNGLLTKAIAAYLDLLKMNERLSDKKLIEVTDRALDRMKFRGNYLGTEPIYRLLIRRYPDDPTHRNNLTVSFLMANRVDLAEEVIKETLQRWPDDRIALAHHGFILKTLHNKLEEAVDAFTKALDGDTGPANEPRFYYHLGDSLLLLGRFKEAHEIHKRGAKLGHFLSPAQRSLYNVDRLKSKPWWDVEKTPYARLARALEKSWKEILKEGLAAQALYEKEKEGLKERGEWSQLDMFVRGREVPNRCSRAPVTCSIVHSELAASGCRRGQVKFSQMAAGTHVRPHVGPTNCRLRMHLGLSNTKDTYIRVDQETRQWQTGKVLMFDDSFEHEVWHNGTGTRLVLIVDVWHPDLTPSERRQLPAI